MIGAYNKKAYKLCMYIKLLMVVMVVGIATIVCLAGNNEENVDIYNSNYKTNNFPTDNRDITNSDS